MDGTPAAGRHPQAGAKGHPLRDAECGACPPHRPAECGPSRRQVWTSAPRPGPCPLPHPPPDTARALWRAPWAARDARALRRKVGEYPEHTEYAGRFGARSPPPAQFLSAALARQSQRERRSESLPKSRPSRRRSPYPYSPAAIANPPAGPGPNPRRQARLLRRFVGIAALRRGSEAQQAQSPDDDQVDGDDIVEQSAR
jgi:hypothetical protein